MNVTSKNVRADTSSLIRSDLSKGSVAGKFQFALFARYEPKSGTSSPSSVSKEPSAFTL